MDQWRGKVAVVTGASVGIGEAVVIKLVKYGVNVVMLARREAKLKELAESLNGKEKYYGTVYAKVCDVTNEQAVKDIFSWVDSTLGGISILINNAGMIKTTSLLNGKLEDWQEIMNLNVLALSVCSREAYKSMTKNKIDGHIVQMNSTMGHHITPHFSLKIYNASKIALTVLCDGLRHELQLVGSKIKVSSISPGTVMTELLLSMIERGRTEPASPSSPTRNIVAIQTEDVANAVVSILATPPNVLIAELTILSTGQTVQQHCQPTPETVDKLLNS